MKTDVVVVGGGPGGSAAASYLGMKGIDVTVVERDAHPRFHIGESLTGEAGGMLRELGVEDRMAAFGWPVKKGVHVYGGSGKNDFWVPVKRRGPDGLEDASTWQVRRSDFDRMLWERAGETAELVQGRATEPIVVDGQVRGVVVETTAGTEQVEAEVVVDASGQATWLHTMGLTGLKDRGPYDRQVAIYGHFTAADRTSPNGPTNTHIFYQQRNHWAWMIPIDDDVTSIGVVVPSAYFTEQRESKQDFLLRELRELNPELVARTTDAVLVSEVRASSNYSYQVHEYTGANFLAIGDAHRFADPIFSFGVHLSMNEGRLAAEHIAAFMDGRGRGDANPFQAYEDWAEMGEDVVQDLIDTFWQHPFAFAFFIHRRFTEDMIDMFAGRLYQPEPSEGLAAMRRLLAAAPNPN